jgi:ribosomal protein L29
MDKLDKKEILEMSSEDLQEKLTELKNKYVELKVTHTVTPLKIPFNCVPCEKQ